MDVATIREFRLAKPFRPFALVMLDGRRLTIDFPTQLAISPIGNELAYGSREERIPLFIKPKDVRAVEWETAAAAEQQRVPHATNDYLAPPRGAGVTN